MLSTLHNSVRFELWGLGVFVLLPFSMGMEGGCSPVEVWPPAAPSNFSTEPLSDTYEA